MSTAPVIDPKDATLTRRVRAIHSYRDSVEAADSEDDLLKRYAPLVVRTVHRYCPALPAGTDLDDWINLGLFALVQAWRTYDPTRGASFPHFARIRIKNAIFDELRRISPLSRGDLARRQELEEAIDELSQRLGRPPEELEIAARLGLSTDDYHRLLDRLRGVTFESLSEPAFLASDELPSQELADLNQPCPAEQLLDRELQEELRKRIVQLPDTQRKVLHMFYFEGLRLKDIGELLGFTEARACQIHVQAVTTLRTHFKRIRHHY
jgi:RNA polymerase sigma factor FliA